MDKVHSTRIGDSLEHEGVLYGSMLSEKYAKDFLEVIQICEEDGATKLYGQGRITSDNKPSGFVGTAEDGVFMWPHVYAGVTEDMRCFHEERPLFFRTQRPRTVAWQNPAPLSTRQPRAPQI